MRDETRRSPTKLIAALAGAALALLCVFAGVVYNLPDRLPEMTREEFDAAVARWDAVSPDNYDIEIEVRGRQPAVYRVEVRDGFVRTAQHNGNPIRQRRTMNTWSVPGMFGTIERDLMNVEKWESGEQDSDTPQLLLRAEFDPKWGIPMQYHRIQWGSHNEVRWHVRHFDFNPSS